MPQTTVKAVLAEEFGRLLDVLGALEDFEAGKFKCTLCQNVMTHENVKVIFPLPEYTVGFYCSKVGCRLPSQVLHSNSD